MNKYITILLLLISVLRIEAQEVIEISSPSWELENSFTSPVIIDANNSNPNSHYISIYTADEIGTSVFLDGLSWYKVGGSPGYFGGDGELKIYLKHTVLDSIPTELGTYGEELIGAELVYDSNTESFPIIWLWLDYTFDTGFDYNGSDNLMILVEWYMPGETTEGPGIGLFRAEDSNGKGAMWRGSSFDDLSYWSYPSSPDRPVIRLHTAATNDVGLHAAQIQAVWNGIDSIDVEVFNAGAELLESFTIKSWINGIAQSDFLWTGEIGQNDTAHISYSSGPLDPGFYLFNLISELPNGGVDGYLNNDSLQFFAYSCEGPLSGDYIVGPGQDFTSLLEISYALNTCGISGNVNFSFLPGIYEGQLSLHNIEGTSQSSQISLFSENGNSSSVIFEYAAEDAFDNWVVNLNGSSYINFKDLSFHASGTFDFSHLIVMHNGTSHINIESCQLIGFDHNSFCGGGCGDGDAIYLSTVDGVAMDDIRIIDNFFKYNSSAVFATGFEDHLLNGLFIEDNILRDQHRYGFYVEWANAPIIKNNHIRTANSYTYSIEGIVVWNSIGAFEISGNDVNVSRNGLVINTCSGDVDNYGMVFNNFVYIVDETCSESGMILTLSQYVKILHNTVSTYDDCNSSNAAFFVRGSDYIVKNNIFNSRNGEASISMGSYYFGAAMDNYDANYNMLSGNPIAIVGGNDYDLAGWQNFSGADNLSFVESPSYIYNGDLHLANLPSINGQAQADVLYDFDGEARDTINPVIGADELPACVGPLFGTYYIGEGEEFQSIKSAVNRLIGCGVDGPVDMRIKDGVYEEQLNFYPITGSSEENGIRFISDSGNPENVIIKHEEPQDHVVSFTHSKYITFEKITIQAKGIGLDFKVGSMNNHILDCKISVDSVFVSQEVSEALGNTPINMSGSLCDSNLIEGCTLNYGLYGAKLYSEYYERGHGNRFVNNHFEEQVYYGIYSKHFNGLSVVGNTFYSSRDYNYIGLFFQQSEDNKNISSNKINIEGEGDKYALFSTYSDIDSIANNFISMRTINADQELVGLHLHNCAPSIMFNTISINGVTNVNTKCTQVWISTLEATMTNNLLDNSTNGYTRNDWGVCTSDYNQYSADRVQHIRYNNYFGGGQARDLFMFNYNNGQGDNSIEESASFTAYNDLHILSPASLGSATVIPNLLYDIDGDLRHDSIPDFGADEFGFSVQEENVICLGESIMIGAISDIADAYFWDNGSEESMILVSPSVTTNYELSIVYEADTTVYSINVMVDTIDLPIVEDEIFLCEGDTINIEYPGNFDHWNWSNGSVEDNALVWEEGLITIEVEKGACYAMDSVLISTIQMTLPTIGDSAWFCYGDSVLINYPGDFDSWDWNNGSIDDYSYASNEGYLTVEVSKDICVVIDSIYITSLTIANPNLGDDLTMLSDETVILSTNESFEFYLWSDESEGSELSIFGEDYPLGENIFWVEVINNDGCIGRDSLIINITLIDAIKENAKSREIIVSPQPANHELTISAPNMQHVEIKDIAGAIIYSSTIESPQHNVFITNWTNGVYILQIVFEDNSVYTQRVIKI